MQRVFQAFLLEEKPDPKLKELWTDLVTLKQINAPAETLQEASRNFAKEFYKQRLEVKTI